MQTRGGWGPKFWVRYLWKPPKKTLYLAVSHAIYDSFNDTFLDEVSRCVEHYAAMRELWIVQDGCLAQHDVVVVDVVVLHELEEGLDRVPGPKVVGSGDIDLL